MQQQAEQVTTESKVWEARAQSLKNDVMTGTDKNTDVEFIPGGIRYTRKKSN